MATTELNISTPPNKLAAFYSFLGKGKKGLGNGKNLGARIHQFPVRKFYDFFMPFLVSWGWRVGPSPCCLPSLFVC
jgi:hypothetical protein